MNYDSGEFTTVLDKALIAADWRGFDERKAESRARNKLRGRGIGSYLEVTGPPAKEYGGIRFEPDGTITMLSGTLDYGQGHATPFAQVLGEQARHSLRALPASLQGDSDQLKVGGGTGGSKSALVAQPGLPRGRRQADRAGQADRRPRAGSLGGRHRVRARALRASPAPTAAIGILELAEKLRSGLSLPAGRAAVARRQPHLGQSALLVPQRLPRGRSRDRPRHRADRGGALLHGQRLRHGHQSDAGRPARRMAGSCRASARR